MTIVIGLGTGRSGTKSLSLILNNQRNSVCFHELNPSCASWLHGAPASWNMTKEFQSILSRDDTNLTIDLTTGENLEQCEKIKRLSKIELIGDVASYHLPHAGLLAEKHENIKFVCIERRREDVIESFIRKLRVEPAPNKPRLLQSLISYFLQPKYRNHFIDHDGRGWRPDRTWDKCFPNSSHKEIRKAIGEYWDLYASQVRKLKNHYPGKFEIYPIDDLNSKIGQEKILNFCGLKNDLIIEIQHSNRSI